MSELPRALVVGLGQVGSRYDKHRDGPHPLSHSGAISTNPRVRLVAGVDTDPAAREAFERRWQVPAFAEIGDALADSGADLASLCTPAPGRPETVDRLIDAGVRAIWSEKPLAADVTEGERIVAACEARGVGLQVNFHRRFDPLHRRAAELTSGLGTPLRADFRFSGTLLNFGSHAFDLFRWLVGEPIAFTAAGTGRGQTIVARTEADDIGTFSRVTGAGTTIFDVELTGPSGRLTLAAVGEQLLHAPASPSALFTGVTEHRYRDVEEGGLAEAMSNGLSSLVSHLESGTPIECTGADGVAALRCYEAAEAALERTGAEEVAL